MPRASVKVMRSYDYCHFEIALSSDEEMELDAINELRKQAAILVDEAVRQYKESKKAEQARDGKEWQRESAIEEMKRLQSVPKSDLTVAQSAKLRVYEDKTFWAEMDDSDYWYDSDPDREHHFSMLRRFKDSRVSVTG